MMDEAKYSLNIPLPKRDQFDASAQLTIRADHQEEMQNSVDKLFGEGTFTRVSALALRTLLSLPAEPGPAPTAVPPPAPPSGTETPVVEGATCPECGVGQIIAKYRTAAKGGGYMGRGCNNFPQCKYMESWAPR